MGNEAGARRENHATDRSIGGSGGRMRAARISLVLAVSEHSGSLLHSLFQPGHALLKGRGAFDTACADTFCHRLRL